MHRNVIGFVLIAVVASAIAACASFEERLAGWKQDSGAAGRPVLVYGLDAAAPVAGIALANTGQKTITGLTVTLVAYSRGTVSGQDGGEAFDITSALPAGGIAPGAAFNARWNTDLRSADCYRASALVLSFGDGSRVSIGAKDIDDYLAPVVNKHCTRSSTSAAPSSGY